MLCWGGRVEETTITTTMQPDLFRRGDKIQISGLVRMVNAPSPNGLFVVRRAKGTQYLIAPASGWDYLTHYASKFWNAVQWKFWGVVNNLEDAWTRLRLRLSKIVKG
jgi:hypothetical protein